MTYAERLLANFAARFWAKVERGDDHECWLWTGAISSSGYGNIGVGRTILGSHRVVYEMCIGPIPDGLVIDHLCRNKRCVNPAHLEAVTPRENTLRGLTMAAGWSARTHCAQGHEFTPENTYYRPDGSGHRARRCRTCEAARSEQRQLARKGTP